MLIFNNRSDAFNAPVVLGNVLHLAEIPSLSLLSGYQSLVTMVNHVNTVGYRYSRQQRGYVPIYNCIIAYTWFTT